MRKINNHSENEKNLPKVPKRIIQEIKDSMFSF